MVEVALLMDVVYQISILTPFELVRETARVQLVPLAVDIPDTLSVAVVRPEITAISVFPF
jgi:hypothetical protein